MVTRDPLTVVLRVVLDIIHLSSKLDTFDIAPVPRFGVLYCRHKSVAYRAEYKQFISAVTLNATAQKPPIATWLI
jgi:hypothetical protein